MTHLLPKRLIEVDLPIKRISAHARREKSIRHGHISTLHIWWARRPLAACRAVICAALWPDPADENCPVAFRTAAAELMYAWAREQSARGSEESAPTWALVRQHTSAFALREHPTTLRQALLDFIADFANWDNSTVREYLDTSRALTQAAHEALGGAPGTRPLVFDPFAGGGSIPLEALRVGADAFASDLNPVPVLLNRVVLDYIPKYGQRLADEVRKWGEWIKREAEKEFAAFYPTDPDGATPIAYLWARTIQCEGPGCGAEVPLIRSLWLAKKTNRSVALRLLPNEKAKRVDFQIIVKQRGSWINQDDPNETILSPRFDGTVKRGSATCPCCGYTTPVARVREQLKTRRGGAGDARLMCVVTAQDGVHGRSYRLPTLNDKKSVEASALELERRKQKRKGGLSLIPDEKLDVRGIRHTWAMIYGISEWGDCFTPRQALSLSIFGRLVTELPNRIRDVEPSLLSAIQVLLAFAVGRSTDYGSSLCRWVAAGEFIGNTFGRQAVPMIWDFCEVYPGSDATGGFSGACDWVLGVLTREGSCFKHSGQVQQASATDHPLPTDAADGFVSDPPYYDAVPYAYLSDFFFVWLRRNLGKVHPDLFVDAAVPKDAEIVVDRPHELSNSTHDIAFYERELTKAFAEGRRVLRPDGIGTIVFASKTTASWEAILKAVVDAGWIVTGSWPIDTEMEARIAAQGQARLASSVHLVCRPRENPSGALYADSTGDWRDVLQELPRRIHEWMPRLAAEGVVGADAIFACLGPALEIFSRYSRVEKASGEQVALREYLEHVWAAVSKEALSSLITDTDLSSLEADARITAMWLWTLNSGQASAGGEDAGSEETDDDNEEDGAKPSVNGGFGLEYDAARKIAQGLGAILEELETVVEIKGDKARLLPVAERTSHLFGKDHATAPDVPAKGKKKKAAQLDLFSELSSTAAAEAESAWEEKTVSKPGATVLDRVHQSMILFATGRGEALKRFLVEDGIGREGNFWKLAQALSALYPASSQEKRWVDGVLARKKGLGL